MLPNLSRLAARCEEMPIFKEGPIAGGSEATLGSRLEDARAQRLFRDGAAESSSDMCIVSEGHPAKVERLATLRDHIEISGDLNEREGAE